MNVDFDSIRCRRCGGYGTQPSDKGTARCPDCGGSGERDAPRMEQREEDGQWRGRSKDEKRLRRMR